MPSSYCKIIGKFPPEYLCVAELVKFICAQEKVECAINLDLDSKKKNSASAFANLYDNLWKRTVNYDYVAALSEEYAKFTTVARWRTLAFKKKDIFKGAALYSSGVIMLYDLLHEVGHLAVHLQEDKCIIDYAKYKTDLSYRYDIERQADKWAMDTMAKYSFLSLLNNL